MAVRGGAQLGVVPTSEVLIFFPRASAGKAMSFAKGHRFGSSSEKKKIRKAVPLAALTLFINEGYQLPFNGHAPSPCHALLPFFGTGVGGAQPGLFHDLRRKPSKGLAI